MEEKIQSESLEAKFNFKRLKKDLPWIIVCLMIFLLLLAAINSRQAELNALNKYWEDRYSKECGGEIYGSQNQIENASWAGQQGKEEIRSVPSWIGEG